MRLQKKLKSSVSSKYIAKLIHTHKDLWIPKIVSSKNSKSWEREEFENNYYQTIETQIGTWWRRSTPAMRSFVSEGFKIELINGGESEDWRENLKSLMVKDGSELLIHLKDSEGLKKLLRFWLSIRQSCRWRRRWIGRERGWSGGSWTIWFGGGYGQKMIFGEIERVERKLKWECRGRKRKRT